MIDELVKDIAALSKEYAELKQKESFARNATASCLNKLNGVQKKLDEAFKDLHKNAPADSDWFSRERNK